MIRRGGLNIADFCLIRNACFSRPPDKKYFGAGQTQRYMASAAVRRSAEAAQRQDSGTDKDDAEVVAAAAAAAAKAADSGQDIGMAQMGKGGDCRIPTKATAPPIQFEMRKEGENTGNQEVKATPFWYIGQSFFRATESAARELGDWFEDPAILSDWLVQQQQRMVFQQPLEVSPFGGSFEP